MKKSLLIIFAVLLIVAITIVTYLFFSEKQTNKELIREFELEKEELENEYSHFATQYDELQLTITNDSLSILLDKEKTKVQRLLEELRSVKSSNAAEIRRLKTELSSLRNIMAGYVSQIDSLNRITERQREVIKDVTTKYNTISRKADELIQEKTQLDKKISLAAQLDATSIWIEPQNKRNKKVKRAKDIVRFCIGFTITKNITATTGERIVYVRIMKPDNSVLTKNEANAFVYENTTLSYSIKKYVEYDGEEQQVVVYWNVEEFLYAGTYQVDIFTEKTLIGSQRFALE
jgi:flagellar basal body-associated protein FliL